MERKKLITAAALAVGALVIVIAVMSDDQGLTGVSGTMASPDTVSGVQPANRYRAPQITRNDLQLDDPSFVQLMQNDAFREIVESGDMALIAAIDELSRTADLNLVAELARTNALEYVPDVTAADEFKDISALAVDIGLDEFSELAADGDLEDFGELASNADALEAFRDLTVKDFLVNIIDMGHEKPDGYDFSTLDVIDEIYEKDFADDFKELVESNLLQDIPNWEENGPDPKRDTDWIKSKIVGDGLMQRTEFARTPVLERVAILYRTGYLDRVARLYRTNDMELVARLDRTGYLNLVSRMARTDALERVGRMLRTEGNFELVARLARTDGLERTIAFAKTDRFQRVALLERVDALERVDLLARTGYLQKVDRFARTDGFALMADLAKTGRLWKVSEMAESGELARTISDF